MKKIAFFVQWMLCAGVENALISLSNELIKKGNDVTIYVIKEKGEFINKMPSGVQLKRIPMNEKIRQSIPVGGSKIAIRECVEEKKYYAALKLLFKHKMNKKYFAELNFNFEKIPFLEENYDIAVNFHLHSPFLVWYLSEKVDAKIKYSWIHNDFKTTGYNIEKLERYLGCIDNFFAVSNQLRDEFLEIFPDLHLKTSIALNIIPYEEIEKKGDEYYPDEFTSNHLKILTVGRLEEQKGYNIAINVCEKLKENNLQFDWYVLGEGTQKKFLEKQMKNKNITDSFHLLGTKINPYPYFKNCDIYVQTSLHEGNSIALVEAKLFHRPIITTNCAGAQEQIRNNITGKIVNIDVDSVYLALKEVIQNESTRNMYTNNLKMTPYFQNIEYIEKYF